MEAIFGLSPIAQLIVAPIVAGVALWICFWLIPTTLDKLRNKKPAQNTASKPAIV